MPNLRERNAHVIPDRHGKTLLVVWSVGAIRTILFRSYILQHPDMILLPPEVQYPLGIGIMTAQAIAWLPAHVLAVINSSVATALNLERAGPTA